MRTIAATALVVGVVAFSGISAAAQALATITGVVKDKSGAVLPGVAVRVASSDLVERVRTTVTDGSGGYQVANLPPGLYSVTFSLAGYSPVARVGVEVAAGLTTAVNADMQPALEFADRLPGRRPFFSVPPATPLSRPPVICGLTIVPADPSVDPKIRVPPGNAWGRPSVQDRTGGSMRTIAPEICGAR